MYDLADLPKVTSTGHRTNQYWWHYATSTGQKSK